MFERIRNEPALVAGVVNAALGLLLAFGVDVSKEQAASIMVLVNAVLALVVRQTVTPTAKAGEDGAGETSVILAVATLIGVVLLLFGVKLG